MKLIPYTSMVITATIALCLSFTQCRHAQSTTSESDQSPSQIEIPPARYLASINLEFVPDSMKSFSMVSQVYFGLEENQRFVYNVSAMGRERADVGKWHVNGDSLYIYDLEHGPDTQFWIDPQDDGSYKIYGPNNFILTKEEELFPTKN